MDKSAKTRLLKEVVLQQGFDRVGIAPAAGLPRQAYVRDWLARGHAGEMSYLQRRLDERLDPRVYLPGARSVVVAALNYHQPTPPPPPDQQPRGRVARYAWGADYHEVIRRKLWQVIEALRSSVPEPFEARPCVDTSPLIERELAMQAGVGWIGKNTLVLHPDLGSYFFLGEIVTTLDLEPDAPATDHCGSCRRCLEACPTQAFPEAYQMDATRCISYHTIELRGEIPERFHAAQQDWVFGCDICQEVCPFNHDAPQEVDPQLQLRSPAPYPRLMDLLAWQTEDYRRELKGSAMRRARLDMLQRNARIALDNHAAAAPKKKGGPPGTTP